MAHSKKIFLITKLTLCMIDIEINKTKHGKAKKKYMCVYCHMSKKSRVGRSGLSYLFFFFIIGKTGNSRSRFQNPIPVLHFRNLR